MSANDPFLLGGDGDVEQVFNWPAMGRMAWQAAHGSRLSASFMGMCPVWRLRSCLRQPVSGASSLDRRCNPLALRAVGNRWQTPSVAQSLRSRRPPAIGRVLGGCRCRTDAGGPVPARSRLERAYRRTRWPSVAVGYVCASTLLGCVVRGLGLPSPLYRAAVSRMERRAEVVPMQLSAPFKPVPGITRPSASRVPPPMRLADAVTS